MRRLSIIASSFALLLPSLSLSQPSGPGNQGQPNRPGGAVTLPGTVSPGPGNTMRPPSSRPQFTWRGRSFDRIRGPAWRYPRGFSYRRWTPGAILPRALVERRLWFNNWRMAGIDPPPGGRRWIRFGPDLLLVNMHTRRVEDVIYNVFLGSF